ncbi:MAG: hypothetical protein ACR2OH_09770, partial [Microthrixaceae bacterium]
FIPMLQAIYESTGRDAAVGPPDPLTWEQFTRTLAALSEGLVMQSVADPETITAEFVTEATAAVALALLSPMESDEGVEEREAAFADGAGGIDRDFGLVEIAQKCRPLISSEGSLRSWTSVADAVGLPVLELRNRAQRLSVLEALAFSEPQPFAGIDHGADMRRQVFEGICALVRAARTDSKCAQSLLAERLCSGRDGQAVRALLPLGEALADLLDEPLRSHHDRVVNVALCAAVSDAASSPADAAELACAAHPTLVLD